MAIVTVATSIIVATIPARAASNDAQLLKDAQRVFKPLPRDAATPDFPIAPERVELGRMLFFDPRISMDGTVSCSRCHLAALYGTDGLPKSKGAFDQLNDRRAPTVFNAALQFKVHWRGDRENVEEQARKALTFSRSFGNPDSASAMAKLKAIAGYTKMFQRAFPDEQDPVTADNWGKAIGAYERTLITPSRFDEYLTGRTEALSKSERQGLMYVFKVPGLRNVAMEPPYFHDGSVRTLPEAVRIMASVQLGKTLSDQDTNTIVAFLNSLTGKLPQNFAEAP